MNSKEKCHVRKLIAACRRDLLSEFCMPANASYLKVAEMLIHARYWMVNEPPKTKEEAIDLVRAEMHDRHRRVALIERLA